MCSFPSKVRNIAKGAAARLAPRNSLRSSFAGAPERQFGLRLWLVFSQWTKTRLSHDDALPLSNSFRYRSFAVGKRPWKRTSASDMFATASKQEILAQHILQKYDRITAANYLQRLLNTDTYPCAALRGSRQQNMSCHLAISRKLLNDM